jgi:hypothetical protein
MFKTALMIAALSAALASTSPAQAAIELATVGPAGAIAAAPAAFGADVVYSHSWVSPAVGKLVVSSEPEQAVFPGEGAVHAVPVNLATLLPEPMSWAMIALGMAVIGWLIRHRSRDVRISFV